MLSDEDWFKFANGGYAHPVEVCRLRSTLVNYLGTDTNIVKIAPDYAAKLRYKHRLEHYHFGLMRPTIETGKILRESPSRLIFFRYFDELDNFLQLVLKPTGNKKEIWVCTFHKQTASEIARKQRKFETLHI